MPFTAQTRMSGVDLNDSRLRSGAGYAVLRWVDRVARQGSTPLAVARDSQVLGVTAAKIAGESGVDDFLADATRRPSSR